MSGKEISKQTDALDDPLLYIMSADECYTGSGTCGTVNAWDVSNFTVTLDKADAKFGSTMTQGSLTTSDNGITWTTDSIENGTIDFDDSDETM
ncbi:unnamed protein product [Penicillium salamii]|uniref:Uncharacterized protein n=1 Tax=Penicillium salamii TaxID=1612424 RepID=A0A9W4JE06_9EURO|nr:unnamed protein product [Penicillium salamii]CAG8095627.1 unnamed protein product [Penicillium salamii]CAG8121936.1 unnamed protein product [Penicillium salamii]CAG8133954.1 unnamed protein product [Penicillium salamii]CAG8151946.1 unnamed protein product [Penicillium salamii]